MRPTDLRIRGPRNAGEPLPPELFFSKRAATNRNHFNLESFQLGWLVRGRRAKKRLPFCQPRSCTKLLGPQREKALALWPDSPKYCACPIRTCLWSRVGRRGSGQEASQPPLEDRQPEANRRTPPNGGRGLKQRRTGLFWSLSALQRPAPKEACLSCRACGRVISSSKRWLRSLEALPPRSASWPRRSS